MYCMMLWAFNATFIFTIPLETCKEAWSYPSTNCLAKHSLICLQNQQNSRWSPPINWDNHLCLVRQHFEPERSVQAKKIFLPYGSTTVTCRNTLLSYSDDQHFVSQTCFHCQYYHISLCVSICDIIHETEYCIA